MLQFWKLEVQHYLAKIKSRYWQGCVLSEALRENLFTCLFQLLEAALISWLMAPVFHLQCQQGLFESLSCIMLILSFHHHISSSDSLVRLFPCQDTFYYWAHLNNLAQSSHLNFLNLITSVKSLLQVLGIRKWTSLGVIILQHTLLIL